MYTEQNNGEHEVLLSKNKKEQSLRGTNMEMRLKIVVLNER